MDQRTALIAEIAARHFPPEIPASHGSAAGEMARAVDLAELAVSAAEKHEQARQLEHTTEAGADGPAPMPCPACGGEMAYRRGETRVIFPSKTGSHSAVLAGAWYCSEADCFETAFLLRDVVDAQRHG